MFKVGDIVKTKSFITTNEGITYDPGLIGDITYIGEGSGSLRVNFLSVDKLWCSPDEVELVPPTAPSEPLSELAALREQVAALTAENRTLLDGLAFYAEQDNYRLQTWDYDQVASEVQMDEGETARVIIHVEWLTKPTAAAPSQPANEAGGFDDMCGHLSDICEALGKHSLTGQQIVSEVRALRRQLAEAQQEAGKLRKALENIRDFDVAANSENGFETTENQATAMWQMRYIARKATSGAEGGGQ